MSKTSPLVIGLTGGIGSGKSTVAKLFAELGVPIIDADVLVHSITQASMPAFFSIVNHFGEKILLKNKKNIDRKKLRTLIFNHPSERQWLENLLHPLVLANIQQQIKTISAPYCIAVIPLLLEVTPQTFIDRILVVDIDERLQIERAILRDKVKASDIAAIIKTQISREKRITQAQDVINNNGTLEDLRPQVDKLHQMYLKISD